MTTGGIPLVFYVVVSVCWAALAGWLADRRSRSVAWAAVLGFLLGPIGLAVSLLLPKRRRF